MLQSPVQQYCYVVGLLTLYIQILCQVSNSNFLLIAQKVCFLQCYPVKYF